MHDPLFFLNEDNYGVYNRPLAKAIGLVPAVVLSELIQKRRYHASKRELINDARHGDGWFYHTIEAMEERVGITRHEQESALKKLKDLGLIEAKVFGLPARRHFRLNDMKVLEVLGFSNNVYSLPENGNLFAYTQTGKPESVKLESRKTEPHHIEELKEKNIKEKEIAPTSSTPEIPSLPPKFLKKERATNVTTSDDEHEKLVKKHGADIIAKSYEALSEWKESADPKQVNRHNSDYYRINKWVVQQVKESEVKAKLLQSQEERINGKTTGEHRKHSKLRTSYEGNKTEYDWSKNEANWGAS